MRHLMQPYTFQLTVGRHMPAKSVSSCGIWTAIWNIVSWIQTRLSRNDKSIDRFIRFCRTHSRDEPTDDKHTNKQTDDATCVIRSNSPHLCTVCRRCRLIIILSLFMLLGRIACTKCNRVPASAEVRAGMSPLWFQMARGFPKLWSVLRTAIPSALEALRLWAVWFSS